MGCVAPVEKKRVGRNTSVSLVGKQVDYGLEETKILF
jgi:hypothetical protein